MVEAVSQKQEALLEFQQHHICISDVCNKAHQAVSALSAVITWEAYKASTRLVWAKRQHPWLKTQQCNLVIAIS